MALNIKKSKMRLKIRGDKALDRAKHKSKLSVYKTEYRGKNDDELLIISTNIIRKLNVETDSDTIVDLEIKLEALKYIIDEKIYQDPDIVVDDDYGFYPDYIDKQFNKKIISKKEFYINKDDKYDETIDLDSNTQSVCKKFKLSTNQIFLKTFLSSNTPYNGILLFHGTGVGKTCSSISIAEQYKDELTRLNKKVIILLNPSIKANFLKNIFNLEKVKQKDTNNQCTKDSYLKEVGSYSNIESLEKLVNKKINSRYNFFGYLEFSNMVEELERNAIRGIRKELHKQFINAKIKEVFSNSIMIIDEAHNIKDVSVGNIDLDSDSSKKVMGKRLPPILENIVRIADNMKLILLSATPMFDNATEIIWLLNLLLLNDNRAGITISDVFDKHGNITRDGTRI